MEAVPATEAGPDPLSGFVTETRYENWHGNFGKGVPCALNS